MDYSSLPHFCRREGSGPSRSSNNVTTDDCFSFNHSFHQQFYNYIKQQSLLTGSCLPIKQGSCHVTLPEPDTGDGRIVRTIESEFHKHGDSYGLGSSFKGLRARGNWRSNPPDYAVKNWDFWCFNWSTIKATYRIYNEEDGITILWHIYRCWRDGFIGCNSRFTLWLWRVIYLTMNLPYCPFESWVSILIGWINS